MRTELFQKQTVALSLPLHENIHILEKNRRNILQHKISQYYVLLRKNLKTARNSSVGNSILDLNSQNKTILYKEIIYIFVISDNTIVKK